MKNSFQKNSETWENEPRKNPNISEKEGTGINRNTSELFIKGGPLKIWGIMTGSEDLLFGKRIY